MHVAGVYVWLSGCGFGVCVAQWVWLWCGMYASGSIDNLEKVNNVNFAQVNCFIINQLAILTKYYKNITKPFIY